MSTATEQNGHAGSPAGAPAGAGTGTPATDPPKEKEKALLLTPATHRLVREAAKRLGRPNDAIVRRAIHLLNRETQGEQAKTHTAWADEVVQ